MTKDELIEYWNSLEQLIGECDELARLLLEYTPAIQAVQEYEKAKGKFHTQLQLLLLKGVPKVEQTSVDH